MGFVATLLLMVGLIGMVAEGVILSRIPFSKIPFQDLYYFASYAIPELGKYPLGDVYMAGIIFSIFLILLPPSTFLTAIGLFLASGKK